MFGISALIQLVRFCLNWIGVSMFNESLVTEITFIGLGLLCGSALSFVLLSLIKLIGGFKMANKLIETKLSKSSTILYLLDAQKEVLNIHT